MVDKSRIGEKTVRDYIMEGGLKERVFLLNPENPIGDCGVNSCCPNAFMIEEVDGIAQMVNIVYVNEDGQPCKNTKAHDFRYFSAILDKKEYLLDEVTV